MLELSQIKLPCGSEKSLLEKKLHKLLRLPQGTGIDYTILHHSVDARKKPVLYDVYTVRILCRDPAAEEKLFTRCRRNLPNLRRLSPEAYRFPDSLPDAQRLRHRPLIVGFGPAGILCALKLAEAGYAPLVLERGEEMHRRVQSVEHFWATGELNPSSNIQFGEGGAGTFSDGKLTSNVKDKAGRVSEVLRCFLEAGAPEDIAYEQLPHIGTDRLRGVIQNLRQRIQASGGEILFSTCAEELLVTERRVTGIRARTPDGEIRNIPAEVVILAPGHSARDTIRMLLKKKVPMEAKSYAVGFRVSHPQDLINRTRYGISDPETLQRLQLPAASYKLTARSADGHGVYSFCMCPGGYVVNASSEKGRLAVNGMSDYARDSARANSAIVMTVGPEDYGTGSVLDGMTFQEQLEEKAYRLADGKVPAEPFPEFRSAVTPQEASEARQGDAPLSSEELCIRGACARAPLHTLLPQDLTIAFLEGMDQFGRQIRGYDGEDCYVIGLESRTSSPVRIRRNEAGESDLRGLFPCGEGAGYAGGIMSAAVDGIRTAEQIALRFLPCPDAG